jgi:hypothetical protein
MSGDGDERTPQACRELPVFKEALLAATESYAEATRMFAKHAGAAAGPEYRILLSARESARIAVEDARHVLSGHRAIHGC